METEGAWIISNASDTRPLFAYRKSIPSWNDARPFHAEFLGKDRQNICFHRIKRKFGRKCSFKISALCPNHPPPPPNPPSTPLSQIMSLVLFSSSSRKHLIEERLAWHRPALLPLETRSRYGASDVAAATSGVAAASCKNGDSEVAD